MLTFAFVGMELCWVVLAFGLAWLGWGGGSWPLPPAALLGSPLGLAAARLTPPSWRPRAWFDGYRWGLALVGAAVAALLAAPSAGLWSPGWLVLYVGGVGLFWRGWTIGDDVLDAPDVEAAFQVGAVAVLALLAALQWSAPAVGAGLGPAIGFFLFGLLALGLARRSERRGRGAALETDWLALVAVLAIGTLVAGVGLVGLVSPDLLQVLADQGRSLLSAAGALVGGLVQLLGGLFGLFAAPVLPEAPSAVPQPAGREEPSPAEPPLFDVTIPPLFQWVVARLIEGHLILLLGYGAYRLVFFGFRRVGRSRLGAERRRGPPSETLPFSWGQWWRLFLTRLIANLVQTWGGRGNRGRALDHSGGGHAGRRTREQHSVRALYRQFLGASARLGLPRAPHQTPDEFAAHLAARRPEASAALVELTRLYVWARYSEERVGDRHVAAMRAAVERATVQLRE